MEITDEIGHRALAYVAAVQAQGYALMQDELEAYMRRPERRGRRVSLDLSGSVVGQHLRRMQEAVGASLGSAWGAAREPAETVSEWLARLGWVEFEERSTGSPPMVRITALGTAVLAHLDQESMELEVPVEIVLDQDDPLAAARVISELHDLGACVLVDPYFSMERLHPILQSTEIDRILTGVHDSKRLTGLEHALAAIVPDRPIEVRESDVFHDRFAIPDEGDVLLLGTSLSGVGKRLSMMVHLRDAAVTADIRNRLEAAWHTAEIVGVAQPIPETEDGPEARDDQDNASADAA